jgi:hypothetical protein
MRKFEQSLKTWHSDTFYRMLKTELEQQSPEQLPLHLGSSHDGYASPDESVPINAHCELGIVIDKQTTDASINVSTS